MINPLRKHIYVILGSLSLGMGILGIFLPVLPTTPFLLLSAFLYLRSSEKLYRWLVSHRILGIYIHNYLAYRAVTIGTKVYALIFLWVSLIISMILVNIWWVQLILLLVGIGVSTHILLLKTLKKPVKSNNSEENKGDVE